MRYLAIAVLVTTLQGCSLLGWKSVEPITIEKKAVERTRLNLPDPTPLKPGQLQWIVITPQNAERVWAELRSKNIDLVLFALTDDGYEELAVDMAQIRNFLAQQREIIIKYREYYEPKPAANDKQP